LEKANREKERRGCGEGETWERNKIMSHLRPGPACHIKVGVSKLGAGVKSKIKSHIKLREPY
jgi:hypothetical protein